MTDYVLISLFEVPKGRDDEFVALWHRGAAHTRAADGFVWTKLCRDAEGATAYRYVSVTLWQSVAQYKAAFSDPRLEAFKQEFPFTMHPNIYEVVAE